MLFREVKHVVLHAWPGAGDAQILLNSSTRQKILLHL